MTLSLRSLVCLLVLSLTACNSPEASTSPANADSPAATQGQQAVPATADGTTNLSAHAVTIHKMSTEMVHLMDDVHQQQIMSPPLKVSDARNAFMERLDWLNDMTSDDVAKLRQATANLDSLIAEIRAHPNATGDAALEARLKKIEDWNRSIKEGLPR